MESSTLEDDKLKSKFSMEYIVYFLYINLQDMSTNKVYCALFSESIVH